MTVELLNNIKYGGDVDILVEPTQYDELMTSLASKGMRVREVVPDVQR